MRRKVEGPYTKEGLQRGLSCASPESLLALLKILHACQVLYEQDKKTTRHHAGFNALDAEV